MLINDKDAAARLASPSNLINKLRSSDSPRKNAMNLFGMGRPSAEKLEIKEIKEVKPIEVKKEELVVIPSFNPFKTNKPDSSTERAELTPSHPPIEELIENSDTQIRLAHAHDKALELLNRSVEQLSMKLDDVKADKLPGVITAASKVVDNIRRERNEAVKSGKDREVHYHFYTPQQRKVSDYEVIDVPAS